MWMSTRGKGEVRLMWTGAGGVKNLIILVDVINGRPLYRHLFNRSCNITQTIISTFLDCTINHHICCMWYITRLLAINAFIDACTVAFAHASKLHSTCMYR